MPNRLLLALLAVLTLALALAACGGDNSSTGGETTVMRHSEPAHGNTLLPLASGHGGGLVKPATYSFSVDGDLIGKSLDWHGWGEAKAIAFGTLVERPASGLKDTYSGSVTASGLRTCKGAHYYTEVFPHLPAQADYVPTEPTKLTTPCG